VKQLLAGAIGQCQQGFRMKLHRAPGSVPVFDGHHTLIISTAGRHHKLSRHLTGMDGMIPSRGKGTADTGKQVTALVLNRRRTAMHRTRQQCQHATGIFDHGL